MSRPENTNKSLTIIFAWLFFISLLVGLLWIKQNEIADCVRVNQESLLIIMKKMVELHE